MTARQHVGYDRRRAALLERLGGVCQTPGCGTCFDLQFDHIDAGTRTWHVRSAGRLKRIALYEREADLGLLQLLCRKCNARKSANNTNAKIRAYKALGVWAQENKVNFLAELDT
jgi:hypothetical protein